MEFKDRKAEVFSPEILRYMGLDDSLQNAFMSAERVRSGSRGGGLEEFARVATSANAESEKMSAEIFGVKVQNGIFNLYSPFEEAGVQLPHLGTIVEINKQNSVKLFGELKSAFEFTMSTGSLGIESAHIVKFGHATVGVDYDGRLSRRGDGFEYLESERSWSVGFKAGGEGILLQDALVVKFE